MEKLLKDVERIQSLEIQGAINIAVNAIQFLSDFAKRIKSDNLETCFENTFIETNKLTVIAFAASDHMYKKTPIFAC